MAEEKLNIQDIVNIVQIVDYAANQGAFKGFDTMRNVIEVRDRIDAWVQSLPQNNETDEPETEKET